MLGEMEKIFNMQLDSDPVSSVLRVPNKCIVSSANKKLFNILSFAPRKKIFYLIGLVINLHHLKDGIRSFLSWLPRKVLPMYYIKKQVGFIKSGHHIWTIWNLTFTLLYYKEYCNCVILWAFNCCINCCIFSAVFSSSSSSPNLL